MKNSALILSATLLSAALLSAVCRGQEVELSADDRKQVDAFEAHSLKKADETFNKKDYRAAVAEYEAFLVEFPQSRIMPYILLRVARSTQLDNKLNQAIKKYREVLDYFPNAIHYAAAALYYTGTCYAGAGDPENAIKAWLQMVQDKGYSTHFLAAFALNDLAVNYMKQNNPDSAMIYYERVASEFRTANPSATMNAIQKAVEYRVKTRPDEQRLRAFYGKAQGFGQQPVKIEGDPAASKDYWEFIRKKVREYGGRFKPEEAAEKKDFFAYWAKAMAGRFPDWDDLQIDVADFQFAADGDATRRNRFLDEQFAKHQKPGDQARIVKWIGLFTGNSTKLQEYYQKLDMSKMSLADKEKLVFTLIGYKEYDMAASAFAKMPLEEMNDTQKADLVRRLHQPVRDGFPHDALLRLCQEFNDPDLGRLALLRFYHWAQDARGVEVGEALSSSDRHASEAAYKTAELLFWGGKYEDAIKKFQLADNPPQNLYRVAECYSRMKEYGRAVETLREVENFFIQDAPRAAMRIANVYNEAGKKDDRIAALRGIMKKYPGSDESRTAHVQLAELGVDTGGGVDADR